MTEWQKSPMTTIEFGVYRRALHPHSEGKIAALQAPGDKFHSQRLRQPNSWDHAISWLPPPYPQDCLQNSDNQMNLLVKPTKYRLSQRSGVKSIWSCSFFFYSGSRFKIKKVETRRHGDSWETSDEFSCEGTPNSGDIPARCNSIGRLIVNHDNVRHFLAYLIIRLYEIVHPPFPHHCDAEFVLSEMFLYTAYSGYFYPRWSLVTDYLWYHGWPLYQRVGDRDAGRWYKQSADEL